MSQPKCRKKKKVSKGLQEAKTLTRYKVLEILAPSASKKVMGGGGMTGRCKGVVFFALLGVLFVHRTAILLVCSFKIIYPGKFHSSFLYPNFPKSFLKVQS